MTLQMVDSAERNDDGDLVWEKSVGVVDGTTQTREVNVSALLQETPRTSGDVSLLVIEAELIAEGRGLDNPAKPTTAEVAEQVVDRLDDGVQPAWEVAE